MPKKSIVKELELKVRNLFCPPEVLDACAGRSLIVDRLIAAHDNAAASTLIKISENGDENTRRLVGANPNAPADALLEIANEFPLDVLSNPAFTAIFRENPQRFDDLWSETSELIVAQPQCPEDFANLALIYYSDPQTFDPDVLNGYLKNPTLTIAFIERILSLKLPYDLSSEDRWL